MKQPKSIVTMLVAAGATGAVASDAVGVLAICDAVPADKREAFAKELAKQAGGKLVQNGDKWFVNYVTADTPPTNAHMSLDFDEDPEFTLILNGYGHVQE